MPVPSLISDLSKVPSENSPAGTESVKGTIDDYLRAGFAFDRQISDLVQGPTVSLASAATVNIGFAASSNISITGTTTITAFDNIAEGTMRWVTFAGALTLTHDAAKLQLPGAGNIATAAGDVALFKSLGAGNWKCMGYQRVSGTGPHAATTSRDGYLTAADWAAFNAKLSAAGAAATYLPKAGGNMTGALIFENNTPIRMRDAGGTPYTMMAVSAGNDVQLVNAGGNNWQIYNQAVNQIILNLTNSGVLTAPVITETSDERKKKCWKKLPIDLIERLAGIKKAGTFRWKKGGAHAVGIGAQSLEAIVPEAVYTDEAGGKAVNTGGAAMAILPEVARELLRLRARLDKLEGR